MKDNTNFETLIKNLENNPDLYEFVFNIIMNEREYSYNRDNPVIREGINRLCDYLDRQNQSRGYLLVYDLRKETGKQGEWEKIEKQGKEIFAAWV